ncbi:MULTISPECIES: ATP-binding protein [Halobacterium]|uniref:ATP-binding protein n=1 Tax=Halobacterium TaxID=2239 RepID=UPI001964D226|nr:MULTISPECIES: ATP-binding protein [Halobacterium]MCF2166445.1 PAS domain S-box protein [Halobacterium salinarum]MCF2168390.1 PAS domain S-box protein [Halobacterium salinarum]QRY23389.1 PAS domain S-box protein [Halobacterium sp. GSL-19]WJK64637.1 PAS domain S-box protein [Halobacterium salinarum]
MTGSRRDAATVLESAAAITTATSVDRVFDALVEAVDDAVAAPACVATAAADGLSVHGWTGDAGPETLATQPAARALDSGTVVRTTARDAVTVPVDDHAVVQVFQPPAGGDDDAVAVLTQLAAHATSAIQRLDAQRRAEASEQRFHALFEAADDALVLYGIEDGTPTAITHANESANALFELPAPGLCGHRLPTLVDAAADAFAPGNSSRRITTTVTATDTVVTVIVHPLPAADGVDAFAELRDVTEHVERERALTSLHDATRRMFDTEDREAIASIVIDAATALIDLPHVGLFFADADALVPAAAADAVTGTDLPALEAGDSIAWEVYTDGTPRWVTEVPSHPNVANARTKIQEEYLLPLGDHGVLIVGAERSGVLSRLDRDLAGILAANATAALDHARHARHLRDRETDLRRERNRLHALFENVPSPTASFVIEDGAPIVQSVNDAFETVFGWTEADLAGENIDEYIVPADTRRDAAAYNRKMKAGETVNVEVQRRITDGVRDFLLDVAPFRLADPSVHGFAVYTDITDRKERERELERQNERLEEFASIVSHDLRSPLNVARGRVELAEETGASEHFDRATQALDRMGTLIEDVLALARHGNSLDDTTAVALAEAATDAWQTVATTAATIEVADPPTVQADPTRLRSLLENLFRNAVEHGRPDAGEPPVDGAPITVTVGALPDADGPGFYVADDGVGVPPDRRDVVFESGTTFSDTGTGFGLAIVENVADAHGWRVTLTDSADGGARFEFRTDGTPPGAPFRT